MEGVWMPQRGSLVAECVRVMRLRIEAGEWSNFLPGERRLAELLQVGRDTVRLTLAELEHEGLLAPAEAGKRRRVAGGRRKSPVGVAKSLRIGMLSPQRLERLSQPMLLEVDHIRRALAEKGGSFEVFAPGWYESNQPGRRLDGFIEGERRGAWILHRSSGPVQRWFADHRMPCLVRGTPYEGVSLPFLDIDWQATARHAAGMLWRMGHRKIGVMTPPDRLRGVEAALKGARETGEEAFEVMELAENGTTAGIERLFVRAMRLKEPPTALIATRARQVATLFGCAARAGLRVPEDLSLVSLAREPFLEYLVPEVTGYLSDPAVVAKQVVRRLEQLVAGNANPGGNPWLVPEVVKGGSVAPPREK
ncbi:substrate-binding domain-containing protein [Haloferula sp. A504]|uniref:substrate-binding domain-containing protein n=1 Tax=Haloferula sp. A504 TaxID=3373601 RepID=UPI0031C86AA8|nr:substrate-binding domain-containing protein [Verrucomicrobiaceae bacterium E54]